MKTMICYNGSRSSRKALDYAIMHAKTYKSKVFVVASMEKGDDPDELIKIRGEHESAAEKLEKAELAYETHLLIRGLDAGEDLVKYARDQNMTDIIIGIRQRSKLDKMVFGSLAQYVILNAHCPVITLK